MPELLEPVIQTDALEPTMYDVMDQLIALHDRIDTTDDRIDNFREYVEERFTELLPLKAMVHSIQLTLNELVRQKI